MGVKREGGVIARSWRTMCTLIGSKTLAEMWGPGIHSVGSALLCMQVFT